MDRLKYLFRALPPDFMIKIILLSLIRRLTGIYVSFYFSQTGEDIIIQEIIKKRLKRKKGFYIDVGCNDPIIWSNTFKLYLEGWHGINIDANPKLIERVKQIKKKDISLCYAISDKEEEVSFFESDTHAVSTINKETYQQWNKTWNFKEPQVMQAKRLDSLLDQYLSPDQEIDLLSIDVEGHDINVLQSIDLYKYRPKLIIIEMHKFSFENYRSNPTVDYLEKHNFSMVGYVTMNGYFIDNKFTNNKDIQN